MASNAAQFAALDNTSFNRFHLKTILVSGIGFFTDALDIFVINLAIPMISYVWWPHLDAHKPSKVGGMPAIIMSLLKASTQMGTFMGQIVFGYLGDKLGRKATYGIVLGIIIGATINTALASDTKGSIGIGAMLILWRIILGIGIGGDYPISAVIASEFASVSTRGLMVAAVFSMQGLGILAGALLCIVSLAIFKPTLETTPDSLYNPNFDNVWRLLLFLGIVPAIVAVYWRLQVPETPRFTAAVGGDAELAMKDVNKVVGQMGGNSADIEAVAGSSSTVVHTTTTLDPSQHGYLQEKYAHLTFTQVFGNWKNGKMLFATAAAWCLLDIGFYGVQLNQSSILTQLGYGTGDTAFDYFWSVAVGNLVVTLCGAAPGYFFTVFTIEKLGRKVIQIGGFAILS
ncbi:major facilitator superfamily domain-containing protein, partial [Blastocladiella britannica]